MNDKIHDLMKKKLSSRKKYGKWKKIVTTLAGIVVFCTAYMLILPAITMENATICGKEEHVHSEKCYEKVSVEQTLQLECTYESLGVHIHDDNCKDENGTIDCGYADYIVHEHTDMCYDAEQNLVCELSEVKEHKHNDDCYQIIEDTEEGDVETVLICDQSDKVVHDHTIACYDTSSGENVLTCEKLKILKHTHTEACMKNVATQENEEVKLTCEKEEHKHDDSCLPKESNENSEATISDGTLVRPESLNAWAETNAQEEAPIMRSYSMKNNRGASTYAMARSGALDLTEWITKVTMYKHEDGKKEEIQSGSVVYEGDLIQFKLEYTIEGQQLGKMEEGEPTVVYTDTVEYQIPETFKTVNGNSGYIYNSDDEVVGTFNIDSTTNKIILKYYEEYVLDNAEGKQINGYISFYSIVDKITQENGEDRRHEFNSEVIVDLNVQQSQEVKGDLSVEKAITNVEGKVIEYMLSVSSLEGTHGPVTLTDVMSEGLSYIDGTFEVTNKGKPVNFEISKRNGVVTVVLPEMNAGETYFITYSAQADINLFEGNTDATNTVTVESTDNRDNPVKDTTTVTHTFEVIDKTGKPGEAGTIDWEIVINKQKFDISGWTLKDVLNGTDFRGPVNIYNSSNRLVASNVMLPYTFPNGSTDTYYVRYTTDHSFVEGKDVTNKATLEKDGTTTGDQDGTGAGTPIEKIGRITGDVYEEDGMNYVPITWTVTIDTSIGSIPSGEILMDKTTPPQAGPQDSVMSGEQVLDAYYAVRTALQQALNTTDEVLSGGRAALYDGGTWYSISDIESNRNGCRNFKYREFNFTLAKEIPQGKLITFTYETTGKFYNNVVINSTFVNRFSISDSYEVTAKVNYSVANIQAKKMAVNYYDPNEEEGKFDWNWSTSETAYFTYENLKENYLAWAIEVDVPPGYTGTGDVTIYEDLPDGVTVKGIRIAENSGASGSKFDLEIGKTTTLENEPYGEYTIKVTESGDLEIIIPESLIKYHSQYAENNGWFEFWTFFHIYTQINDTSNWPYISDDSLMCMKSFENKFTVVDSNNDTITFGKQTQVVTRDDSTGHVIKGASTDQNYVTYEVVLNPEGRDFDSESSTIEVSDVLTYYSTEEKPLSAKLVAKSVKLYAYEGKGSDGKAKKGDPVDFSYVYDEAFVTDRNGVTTATHTIDLVIPDGKPVVLEYKYRMDGKPDKHSIANTCTIKGVKNGSLGDDFHLEMDVKESDAGADTSGVTIYKVDMGNYGIYIPDAKFELFIWNEDDNAYINVTDKEGNKTFVTDPNGKIVLDFKTDEGGIIAKNTAYKLVEIESPDNYYLLDEPYYFYVASEDLVKYPPCMPNKFEGKELKENGTIYLTNESSYTKLAIRKLWKDLNENDITVKADQVSEVRFELWRRTVGVKDSDVNVGTYTITPDENGFWETVITNLPKGERNAADGSKNSTYVYYVKEVSVPGYEVFGYTYDDKDPTTNDANGIQTGTIVITNREVDGYRLPETGGFGTTLYTIGGLLLMLSAMLYFLLYKNKTHNI